MIVTFHLAGTLVLVSLLACLEWPIGVYGDLTLDREDSIVPRPVNIDKSSPILLYRGDTRSLSQIKEAGGILPRGSLFSEDEGFSVYQHMRGKPGGGAPENSVYVSTSLDPKVAVRALGRSPGYVYEIHASENMFSMDETLKGHSLYRTQKEFVALGGIRPDQITGVAKVEKSDFKRAKGDPMSWLEFKRNAKFDRPKYRDRRVSGPQPELAGFPAFHPAAGEPMWKSLMGNSLRKPGVEFLESVRNTGWEPPEAEFMAPALYSTEDAAIISEKFAEEEFARMLVELNLETYAKREVRTASYQSMSKAFKGYYEVAPKWMVPKYGPKVRYGAGALAALGAGLWIRDVVDSFERNATTLERTAVLTSIVPIVGCLFEAAAEMEQNVTDVVDTVVCVVADAFLLGPAWPVGVVLHAARELFKPQFWRDAARFWQLKDPEKLHQQYIADWEKRRAKVLEDFESDEFFEKVKIEMTTQQIGVVYLASRAAGALRAGTLATRNASAEDLDSAAYDGREELMSRTCQTILKERDNLQRTLESVLNAHLEDQYAQFDCRWFKEYRAFWDDAQGYALISISIEPHLELIRAKFGRDKVAGLQPGPGGLTHIGPLLSKVLDRVGVPESCSSQSFAVNTVESGKVTVCDKVSDQPYCHEFGVNSRECVNVVEKLSQTDNVASATRSVSQVQADNEAGSCSFFTDFNCGGRFFVLLGPSLDLSKNPGFAYFQNRVRSVRCDGRQRSTTSLDVWETQAKKPVARLDPATCEPISGTIASAQDFQHLRNEFQSSTRAAGLTAEAAKSSRPRTCENIESCRGGQSHACWMPGNLHVQVIVDSAGLLHGYTTPEEGPVTKALAHPASSRVRLPRCVCRDARLHSIIDTRKASCCVAKMWTWPWRREEWRPIYVEQRSSSSFVIATISVATFTDTFLYAVVVPVLPFALSDRIGLPRDRVQFWASISLAVKAILGYIADRTQCRRALMLGGLILLLMTTLILCFSDSIAMLLVGRALQGMSAAMVWSVGYALVVDSIDSRHIGSAMGWLGAAASAGLLVAPLLGGIVYSKAGYYAVFAMCFGLIALDVVLRLCVVEADEARRWLSIDRDQERQPLNATTDNDGYATISGDQPASQPASESQVSVRPAISSRGGGSARLGRNTRLLAALCGTTFQSLITASFNSTLPLFVASTFGWGATGAGLIFLALITPTFGGPIAGALSDRYGVKWLATGGFLTAAPLLLCLGLVHENTLGHIVLLCCLLAGIGTCCTLIFTPLMAEITWSIQQDSEDSTSVPYALAYGLNTTAFSIGAIVGPVLGGLVRDKLGWPAMGLALGVICLIAALVQAIWVGGPLRARGTRLA